MSRRLPIYLLLDVSNNMSKEHLKTMEDSLQMLIDLLKSDPSFVELAHLSIVTYSNHTDHVLPLTDVNYFQIPTLKSGEDAHFGQALTRLKEIINTEILPSSETLKGDFSPYIFALVNGKSIDSWENAGDDLLNLNKSRFVLFVGNYSKEMKRIK